MDATPAPQRLPRWVWLASLFAFTLFWIATRFQAIRGNPLFFDDYFISDTPVDLYLGTYRPLLLAEHIFFESLYKGHFFTRIPKIAAAFYMGATATAFAALLRRWGVATALVFAAPLLLLSNPVLNDAGLWQSGHALSLALALITLAAVVWEPATPKRLLIAGLLIFCGINGYQIFISLALLFVVCEPVVKSITGLPWRLRDAFLRVVVIGIAGAMQIALMLFLRAILPHDPRGFAQIATVAGFVKEKIHGVFNLAVNGLMPLFAWYFGAVRAMSLWKWVPLAIAVLTLVVLWKRGVLRALAAAALPFLALTIPALPTLIMSQSPYAWRVSSPVAFGLVVSCIPLLSMLPLRLSIAIIVVLSAVMIPVAYDEARMRSEACERNVAVMRETADHWKRSGVDPHTVTIAYVRNGAAIDERLIGAHDLTYGYERQTPETASSFSAAWAAQQFVTFNGFRFADCQSGDRKCRDAAAQCARNCTDVSGIYPRVIHDRGGAAMSFVCADPIPGPLPTKCR